MCGDRTYKLSSGTMSEYGRYVESLWEPRDGSGPQDPRLVNSIHESDALMGAAGELATSIADLPGDFTASSKQKFLEHQANLFES